MAAIFAKSSQLPKEVLITRSSIPGAGSAGDVTTVDTDLESISLTNTTSASIPLALMNAASAAVGNFSAYPIDPGDQPFVIQFDPPIRFAGGMKWLAGSAGLTADVKGWRHAAYSVPVDTRFGA